MRAALSPPSPTPMRWQQSRRSGNVIDARGRGRGAAGLGLGTVAVLLLGALFGVDLSGIAPGLGGGEPVPQATDPNAPADEARLFTEAVLGDTEDTWNQIYAQQGQDYPEPALVMFSGGTQSGCGPAQSAMGPFYCPADQRLYVDPTFFNELARLGGTGDLAAAYVIAHEVGHHVQNIEGTLQQVNQYQGRLGQAEANALQVRVELQADCYAGVWANHAQTQRNLLESGDLEEALSAASAVGDDHLQRMAGRRVQREAFTHGSSEQRAQAFQTGFQNGTREACDTFADLR